jgi:hypothetical protein
MDRQASISKKEASGILCGDSHLHNPELWLKGKYSRQIPPASFSGMLVRPCNSQIARCLLRSCLLPTWNCIPTCPISWHKHPLKPISPSPPSTLPHQVTPAEFELLHLMKAQVLTKSSSFFHFIIKPIGTLRKFPGFSQVNAAPCSPIYSCISIVNFLVQSSCVFVCLKHCMAI